MDVAGVGLAVVSLTLQLLGGCIRCYEAFLAVTEMPARYEHLRIRMSLEQARLLSWGEKMGLSEDTLEEPSLVLRLHRNTIVDVLSEIQRLFRECLTIQTRIEGTNAYSSIDPSMPKSFIKSPLKNTLFAKALRAWDKTTELPVRLQWALVKQDKFADLVEQLISYNDSIISLLDRVTIQRIHENQVLAQMTLLRLTSKVDDLYKLILATQISTSSKSDPSLLLEDSFGRLVNFKAEQLTVEAGSASTGKSIEKHLIQIDTEIGARSLASYNGRRVWIEWKRYGLISAFSPEMTETRVQKLVSLLSIPNTPPEFRAPHCLGYTHSIGQDSTIYGLLYEIPMTETRPISLLDLINEKSKPSLSSRTKLAHTISSSLLYLHSGNWLHKGIQSENVLFLASPNEKPDYASPIMSGFEYARPDFPEEETEKPTDNLEHDLYRHPDAIGHPDIRSKKSWDVYSLGIMLLEIAHWVPITKLFHFGDDTKSFYPKIAKVRGKILAESFLSKISAAAGDMYADVVMCCIKGGELIGITDNVDEADPDVAAELQRAVSEHVVEALRNINL